VGEGSLWVRVKTADVSTDAVVAWFGFREDTGGAVGGLDIRGTDFDAANTYQWFRLPFARALPMTIFYVEFEARAPGTLFDLYEVWSAPRPVADTRGAPGVTLDFARANARGVELRVHFLDCPDGGVVEGPRLNPWCSICAPPREP
jgi:hypothetical protein